MEKKEHSFLVIEVHDHFTSGEMWWVRVERVCRGGPSLPFLSGVEGFFLFDFEEFESTRSVTGRPSKLKKELSLRSWGRTYLDDLV